MAKRLKIFIFNMVAYQFVCAIFFFFYYINILIRCAIFTHEIDKLNGSL